MHGAKGKGESWRVTEGTGPLNMSALAADTALELCISYCVCTEYSACVGYMSGVQLCELILATGMAISSHGPLIYSVCPSMYLTQHGLLLACAG